MTVKLDQVDTMPDLGRGPWVEVDLTRLHANLDAMLSALPEPRELMLIVKSNAYGHGLSEVARVALECGIHRFAVAYEEEALQLREVDPKCEILVLGLTQPARLARLADLNITLAVISEDHASWLMEEASRLEVELPVHVKVDTGMGRLGIHWRQADEWMEKLRQAPGIRLTGVFSHFAAVEPNQPEPAVEQVERFQGLKAVQEEGLFRHLSSSRAFLFFPDWDFDGVRAGVTAYGYGARRERGRFSTDPILEWKTTVMQTKTVPANTPVGYYAAYRTDEEADIITVKVGYADGYPRLLSNKGFVCIHGERCRVVGRVSMNWITVLAPAGSGIRPGDEVILIGKQGDSEIWADELARICRTIPYEIVTSIRPGIPRIFKR